MRTKKLPERIGNQVKAGGQVVASYLLSGELLNEDLVVDFFKSDAGEPFVQITRQGGRLKTLTWSLAATVGGDFGKLEKIKDFAEATVDDEHPVAKLRAALTAVAKEAGLVTSQGKVSYENVLVVHAKGDRSAVRGG